MGTRFFGQAVLVTGLVLSGAAPGQALPRLDMRDPLCLQQRGAEVGTALLVEFYNQLPEPKEGEDPRKGAARFRMAVEAFRKNVAKRYTPGTLERVLDSGNPRARQAAVTPLRMA